MEGLSTQSQRQFCGPELEDEDDGDDFEVHFCHWRFFYVTSKGIRFRHLCSVFLYIGYFYADSEA